MHSKLLHTPEGVRDIYGEELYRKHSIESMLLSKIHSFGYHDIQTPTFEYFDIFSNEIGTTSSRELYKFFDKQGDTLCLRSDFTPSIARCFSKYFSEDQVPIRLCYKGNTFTNSLNLQGKLKESTEMGAELMGDGSVEADAEILALVISGLLQAGLKDFQISVGNVEYFRGICEDCHLDDEIQQRLRDIISLKNSFMVEDILTDQKVSQEARKAILGYVSLIDSMTSLDEAKALVSNEKSIHAIERLEAVMEILKIYGYENYISYDLGILSKYHYYTGIVFKAYTYGVGDAICAGGRYDSLLGKFGMDEPAIGFTIKLDDLLTALQRQKIEIPTSMTYQKLYYSKKNFSDQLQKATQLREQGFRVELIPEGGAE